MSDRVQGKWSGRLKEIGIEKRSDMPKNAVDKRRPRSGQASGAIMKIYVQNHYKTNLKSEIFYAFSIKIRYE